MAVFIGLMTATKIGTTTVQHKCVLLSAENAEIANDAMMKRGLESFRNANGFCNHEVAVEEVSKGLLESLARNARSSTEIEER